MLPRLWFQEQTHVQETQLKPNVIFIRPFLYKKHWITGRTEQKHAPIYSMARDGKGNAVRILKTLIKHCALIYFDDIFHISQRCGTSDLFHIEVKHRTKSLKARLKTRAVRSKRSTAVTERRIQQAVWKEDADSAQMAFPRVPPQLGGVWGSKLLSLPLDLHKG